MLQIYSKRMKRKKKSLFSIIDGKEIEMKISMEYFKSFFFFNENYKKIWEPSSFMNPNKGRALSGFQQVFQSTRSLILNKPQKYAKKFIVRTERMKNSISRLKALTKK